MQTDTEIPHLAETIHIFGQPLSQDLVKMEAELRASVHEAKTNLSKLLAKVNIGERVVITRYGIPAAELVPVRGASVNLGSLRNVVSPPPDEFFEPLDEDGLRIWEGE